MSNSDNDNDLLLSPERLDQIKELWDSEPDPELLDRADIDLLIEVAERFLLCTGTHRKRTHGEKP